MIRSCAKMAANFTEINSGTICAPNAIAGKEVKSGKWLFYHPCCTHIFIFLEQLQQGSSGHPGQSIRPKQADQRSPQPTLSLPQKDTGKVPVLTSPSTSSTSSLLTSVQKTFKKETLKKALKDISIKSPNRPKQPLAKEELEYIEALKSLKLDDKARHELKRRMQELDQHIHQKFTKWDIEQISEMVQTYYSRIADSMERPDSPFFSLGQTEKTDALNFYESCVISRNHSWVLN